jgi:protein-S-isoprenylcysteine O-methyltransferase Ste14
MRIIDTGIVIVIISVYILLLVFVMAVILLKIVRKEKVHPGWYCALCFLIILPILYCFTIGSFSVSASTSEILQQINSNQKN